MEPQAIEPVVPDQALRFSALPEAARALWAKGLSPGHGLLAAAVAETLLLRKPKAALPYER
jgi:hypothetical protein